MCGRFSLTVPAKFFSRTFTLPDVPEIQPDYNISPGMDIWAVRNSLESQQPAVGRLRWGLIPSWASDPKIGNKLINARSETVSDKPAFRDAYRNRRCLIPADGFFEWKRNGKLRTPYYIRRKRQQPFAMAGLWERWLGPNGIQLDSCTILTTNPNSLMQPLHDRMPVILDETNMTRWLETPLSDSEIQELITPYPSSQMEAYPVSDWVNSPKNNDPACLLRVQVLEQEELF